LVDFSLAKLNGFVAYDDDDNEDDQHDFRMDNLDTDRRRDPLTNVRSDSPRHSYADLPGVQFTI
jgi:hypothetical protein